MQKIIVTIFVLVAASVELYGQTTDYLMNLTKVPETCDPYKAESAYLWSPWKVSHGTPEIVTIFQQNNYMYAQLKTSFLSGTTETKSEGLFIAYSFQRSHLYDIQVSVSYATGNVPNSEDLVGLNLYATNGLVEKSSTDTSPCPGLPVALPVVSDANKKLINNAYPLSTNNNYVTSKWSPVKPLTPLGDYSQLWIYPDLHGAYQTTGFFLTDRVTIWDLGVDPTRPSMPGVITASAVIKTGFNIAWAASTDNAAVAGYNVYLDGVKKATVYGTSYNITGLTSCTSYNVEVRAFDGVGESPGRTKTVATTPEYDAQVIKDQPQLVLTDVDVKAGQVIYLRPGFTFNSSVSLGGNPPIYRNLSFYASIVSCGLTGGRMAVVPEDTTASAFIPSETRSYSYAKEQVQEEESIQIYPNPVTDELKIDVKSESVYSIKILDDTGNLIAIVPIKLKGAVVNMKSYAKGLYFIEVLSSTGRVVKKVIKN